MNYNRKIMRLELSAEKALNGGYYYAELLLPAADYEIKDAMQRTRAVGRENTVEVSILECDILPKLQDIRLDTFSLDELNFLAKRLSSLPDEELPVFYAVTEQIFNDTDENPVSIKDLINCTYSLDTVPVAHKVGGGRYSSRYPFSGMLVCGICGSKLRRQVRTMGSGKRTASWGCCNRINNGRAECDSHHVNEEVLEATYLTAMRRLVDSAEEVVEVVRDGTELALEPENKAAMERIDEETIQLQEAALALHRAKQRMEIGAVEYASRVKEYSERMKELEAERNELQGTAAK